MEPLYERFGGLEAVVKLVFAFYDRVLRSQRLAPHFAKLNMPRIINHQVRFLSSVMGGPEGYTNGQLREIHAHLGIDDGAFEDMADLLELTLKDFSFSEDEVALIMSDVRGRRAYIVPLEGVSPQAVHTL
jgi:hemoglobin